MAQVTRLGLYGGARAPYAGFVAASTSAVVGGVTAFTETQLVDGTQQTTIQLSNDTWQAAGSAFDDQRQAIIDGFDAAEVEATGWNAEIRDKEVVGSVARTSDTLVTITWTASPLYNITADETITLTIPAAALVTSAIDVTATPTIGVTADVAVESEEANSGGYSLWIAYEQEMLRREDERKRRAKEKKKAQKIKDKLDKELALAERALEEEDARKAELARLNRLVAQQKSAIIEMQDERLTYIMTEALERQTFSAIERLERSLAKMHKEDIEFLLLATEILVNQ